MENLVIFMYIPIAVHKNNLVLIDSMDTFALYYCSSVKQKMKTNVEEAQGGYEGMPGDEESEGYGSQYGGDESYGMDMHDDDDDI